MDRHCLMQAELELVGQELDSEGQPEVLAFSTKLDLVTSVLEAVLLLVLVH